MDARADRPDAIAVLPFSDMSAASDQAYLCEGMAEEIMNALAGAQLEVFVRRNGHWWIEAYHDVDVKPAARHRRDSATPGLIELRGRPLMVPVVPHGDARAVSPTPGPAGYNPAMPPSPVPRDAGRGRPARRARVASCACVLLALASVAGAQSPRDDKPSAPPRVALSGDVTLTVGPDDHYYFNYTDYEQNALRLFTASLGASVAVTSWLEGVGEVRVENDHVIVSALYARVRPWRSRRFTVSAGRVPPVFGAFSLARYGSSNPLISRPLAYQYLTTVRSDLVPSSADALLAVRGRGWLVRYPGTDRSLAAAGLPLASTNHWDTGVVAHVTWPHLEASGGVTTGSLSDPQVSDNNDGKQVVGRVQWRPAAAWTLGASVADGAFLEREAARAAGADGERLPQRALGVDVAFDRGHFRVRGEVIAASWRLPAVAAPRIDGPLDVMASTVEVQYRLSPRVDVAARSDWLGFSRIAGTLYGGAPTPWDANVSRLETGFGLRLARHWRVKLAYQHDWRFGRTRISEGYVAAQVSGWF